MSDFTPPGETSQSSYDQEEIRKLRALVKQLKTQIPTKIQYYTCHAICLNEAGEECTRNLGIVRGMTDNGREGWTEFAPTQYTSLEESRLMLQTPSAFSVYNGHYKGGKTWIKETIEVTTKVVFTQNLEAKTNV